uniref:RIMS binding protein 2a n=1 Tax=Gadus morhua TaxID=8049 RepID=A0A8C5CRC6_GADMO
MEDEVAMHECYLQVMMRGYRSNGNVEELLKQSQMELSWIQRQLAMVSIRNTHLHTKGKVFQHSSICTHRETKPRHEASSLQTSGQSAGLNQFQLLEAGNRALKLEVATLQQEKQRRRTLKAKLHAALQEQHRLNLELINHTLRSTKYDQVRSDYEQLRRTFVLVRRERDAARQDRTHLQIKVEKLEEVLKQMHDVAKERQRLQVEHERALELLHGKQREIDLLQRAPLEADHEHEGAVHLLEVKVRDLEHKCRSQRNRFQLLLDLRSELETSDGPATDSSSPYRSHQQRNLRQILSTPQIGTGDERVANTQPLIDRSLFPRPPPQTRPRERPEPLSVRSSAAATDRPGCPRQGAPSEMEDEVSPSPRSKARYTGQVRLCSARYSYNPYDGPNEHPEAELPLVAGKYLYVYGNMDDDGFYEGELLDGQRGLVPSNFVEFVQDKEKLAIQAGDEGEELGQPGHAPLCIMGVEGGGGGGGGTLDGGVLCSSNALGPCSNGTEEGPPDPEDLAEDVVPYPRRINLIKQLARSVIVGWDPPLVSRGWSAGMSGYAVLVDGELRATVALGGRTKCLLEKLDLDGCVHRVSVQSTTDRGPSDELRCTLLVGANVVVAACGLRVDDIQRDTAELSWLPSNSNYGHTIFLDGAEHAAVKPGRCRLRFVNLKAMTVYKVTVVARPHQVPWQLPLEQREKKEAGVEFCTLAAGPTPYCRTGQNMHLPWGPPLAPQEVQVLCGQAPGVLQVHWKPPPLSPTGTSNGANVIGYVVCTKGQRIAEVLYPLADYVSVELTRIQCLEAREVIVRTLSAQGESQDSPVAVIPNNLLVPPPPLALPPPGPQPLALTLHPHSGPPGPPPPQQHPHLKSPHLQHPQPQLQLCGPPPAPGHPHQHPPQPHPRPQNSQPQPHPHPHSQTLPHPHPQQTHPQNQAHPHGQTLPQPHPQPRQPHAGEPHPGGPHPGGPHPGGPHPGGPHPGGPQPGGQHPGGQHPGGPHPGGQHPGGQHPGGQLPGGQHPGGQHPGGQHPGGPHHGVPHPGGPQGHPHPQGQPRPPNCQPQPLHLQPHQGLRPQHRLPLIPHPHPHPLPKRPVSARDLEAKEHGGAGPPPSGWDPPRMAPGPQGQPGAWDPARMAPPQVHTLEAPPSANPRSPSPQRILPQPRGTLIPDTVAKAIAREAAQRVAAESGKGDRRQQGGYGEQPFHQRHSDEEEEDEEGLARGRRRGPSVDEFLRASELGRPPHYSHSEEYHSESSRGSDLSDILEEDEEELYSEMQLNDEGRRRSSHHALKAGSSPGGRHDRENGRRGPQGPRGGPQPQRRPLMVPSIDGGHRERERRSPPYYSDSKPEESFRIFVALFDYDPLSMSPNPDAADEELPFKEGQIIRVYGDKDTDGFYRGEVCGRMGLIPCNMVSEIRAEDDETLDQLIKQGFLPLNTPIDRIEQNRRGQRRDQATRRMVALYDYDPRESSPNVDVETELTFCAGDIMAVFGEIDEDGFYYGDINGHRGLVPSNFLEEVPDDVEVYLTDIPSHHHHHPPQEESGGRAPANSSHCSSSAANAEGKRVATETADIVPVARSPSPMVLPGTMRPISPARGSQGPSDPRDDHDGDPRDSHDMKKKKGILSKGKKLLKRLSPVNK